MDRGREPPRIRRLTGPAEGTSGESRRGNKDVRTRNVPKAVGPDRELEVGSLAHYEDPAYYADVYDDRLDDIAFYVREAVADGGPVLEYGVGNGRIALPVARAGIAVTGVDHSQAMLADLQARLGREPKEVQERVRVRRGDMRRVRLKQKYSLVFCPFNTALHLYTRKDVEEFLAGVRHHLAPGGRLLVDISVPVLEDLARDPTRAYHAPRFRHPSTGELVRYHEYFDYDRVRQILFVSMVFEPVGAKERAWSTPLTHRQFFPQEWEALLHYNGFAVERMDGDFDGHAPDRNSDVLVVRARLRRGWRGG